MDKKIIIWYWQSSNDENYEWTPFSDFESEYIEKYFEKHRDQVRLHDRVISFSKFDLKYDDSEKEDKCFPIKREEFATKGYVRQERFNYPPETIKRSLTASGGSYYSFGDEWKKKHGLLDSDDDSDCEDDLEIIRDLAVKGILHEAKLLKKGFDGKRMAKKMRRCNDVDELEECCVRLYTASSFLCGLVSKTLRSEDMSKIDTLGPFCYMLHRALFNINCMIPVYEEMKEVYRGATLTESMIEEYRNAIGSDIVWLAFSSTSRDRKVAEMFAGNVLFIIKASSFASLGLYADVSKISCYEDEQEQLFTAGTDFTVIKVDYDDRLAKFLIYLLAKHKTVYLQGEGESGEDV